MASTLYIQLPSKAMTRSVPDWFARPLLFAMLSSERNILQQGRKSFSELKELAASVSQLTFLVAANDVSIVSLKVPPMSMAKLQAALPNLVEDQILVDPAELILLAAPVVDGLCTVMAIDRAWMQRLYQYAQTLGVKRVSAHASSMCLQASDSVTQVLVDHNEDAPQLIELAMRTPDLLGAGVVLRLPQDEKTGNTLEENDVAKIFETLHLLANDTPMHIAVNTEFLTAFQQFCSQRQSDEPQIHLSTLDWKTRTAGLSSQPLDLFSTLTQDNQAPFDWHRWRWTLGLATMIVVIGLLGLNWEWWRLERESTQLRNSIVSIYKSTFPKDTVIRDPLGQMQKNINLAKKNAGESTDDDFFVLAGQFGQAWDKAVVGQQSPLIQLIDYREHTLFVKLKNASEAPTEKLRVSLKESNLTLDFSNDGMMKISPERGLKR